MYAAGCRSTIAHPHAPAVDDVRAARAAPMGRAAVTMWGHQQLHAVCVSCVDSG